jgi:hypothetical protein
MWTGTTGTSTDIKRFTLRDEHLSSRQPRRLAHALEVTTDYLLGRVKELDGLAGADRLHRHYDRLTSDDRDVAESLMELLAKKAESRVRKGEK